MIKHDYINIKTDVLVIGAGIAGLEAALEASRAGMKVVIVNKGASASPGVLGFNAPVSDEDSKDIFLNDTLHGGWDIADRKLVEVLAGESAESVSHMEELGLDFDKDSSGKYHFLKPLGCSVPRLVHSENITGKKSITLIKDALTKAGAEFVEHCMAIDLIISNGSVKGALVLNTAAEEVMLILSKAVILATGGSHLMSGSTYPTCQTADGFALGWRAGTALIDMEFVQHEPCRAVWPKPLGISTTLLAKGGILKNGLGKRFVLDYYPSEGAVPKDILARLIAIEIEQGRGTKHGGVWLDLTGLPQEEIKKNHVLYYERFINEGIDLTTEIVEVGPAAHSMMGGIKIDADAYTGVPGLYAAGEVTGGLHGANRLGGNAGSEIYVFGRIAGRSAAKHAGSSSSMSNNELKEYMDKASMLVEIYNSDEVFDFNEVKKEVQQTLKLAVGPVRCEAGLKNALMKLKELDKQCTKAKPNSFKGMKEKLEVRNLILTGEIVCRAALARQESRGVHYRSDFPERDDTNWKKQLSFSVNNKGL